MTGRSRRAAIALAAAVAIGSVSVGCGQPDDELPTAPDATRAQVTGTVTTTVPRSTSTSG
jgi:hypothetical protein